MDHSTRKLFDEYLDYLPDFQVLICKPCKFAIQPSAIDTHLKQHHIYRERRARLTAAISTLRLAEPSTVHHPTPDADPIRHLPVYNGFKCLFPNCDFTCASTKRMKGHWTTLHGRPGTQGANWRETALQTFFRGNQIRYFEVNGEHCSTYAGQADDAADADEPYHASKPSSSGGPHSPPSAHGSFSIEDMYLFHTFLTSTGATIARGSEPPNFYTETVPQLAFSAPYLMHGILALSAAHLAHTRRDAQYMAVSTKHQSLALPMYMRNLLANTDGSNSDALIIYSKLLIVQEFAFMSMHSVGATNAVHSTMNLRGPKAIIQHMRGGCKLLLRLRSQIREGNAALSLMPNNIDRSLRVRTNNWGQNPALSFLPPNAEDGIPPVEPMLAQRLWDVSKQIESTLPAETCRRLSTNWSALCSAFAIASGSPCASHLWDGVELWAGMIDEQFSQGLDDQDPGVLVLFAHYCILLKLLEDKHWFMQGVARTTFRDLVKAIRPEHMKLIRWPLYEFDS